MVKNETHDRYDNCSMTSSYNKPLIFTLKSPVSSESSVSGSSKKIMYLFQKKHNLCSNDRKYSKYHQSCHQNLIHPSSSLNCYETYY